MNELIRPRDFKTDASPSQPAQPERRRFTGAELEAIDRVGILHPDERVELIDGEIIAMNAKGARHEVLRTELINFWARRLPADVSFAEKPALRLAPHNEPEPDIILLPRALRVSEVRGDTVLLVVEVSDSSLSQDMKVKAPLYARFGVRDYWVIDAETRETHVHRDPRPDGYMNVKTFAQQDILSPLLVPVLTVRLSELRLD